MTCDRCHRTLPNWLQLESNSSQIQAGLGTPIAGDPQTLYSCLNTHTRTHTPILHINCGSFKPQDPDVPLLNLSMLLLLRMEKVSPLGPAVLPPLQVAGA